MNPKERLHAALCGCGSDRAPVVCPGGMMNPVVTALMERAGIHWPDAHLDPDAMATLARAVVKEGLFENAGVPFCMTVEAEAMGATVDFGSTGVEPHVTAYAFADIPEPNAFPTLDVRRGRPAVVLGAIDRLSGKEVPVIGNVPGPFSVATSVVEPSRVFVALKKSPERAMAFLRHISEEVGRFALEQRRHGADVIAISDPSGTAEILGPAMFESFMIPALQNMVSIIRTDGPFPVILHICGRMRKVLEILGRVGASAYSFDSLVSLDEAQRALHAPVMGNISTFAIESATPERIRKIAAHKARSGISIIAPACGLGLNSPLENIAAIRKGVLDASDPHSAAERVDPDGELHAW